MLPAHGLAGRSAVNIPHKHTHLHCGCEAWVHVRQALGHQHQLEAGAELPELRGLKKRHKVLRALLCVVCAYLCGFCVGAATCVLAGAQLSELGGQRATQCPVWDCVRAGACAVCAGAPACLPACNPASSCSQLIYYPSPTFVSVLMCEALPTMTTPCCAGLNSATEIWLVTPWVFKWGEAAVSWPQQSEQLDSATETWLVTPWV